MEDRNILSSPSKAIRRGKRNDAAWVERLLKSTQTVATGPAAQEANARLVAAAPELLAALKAALDDFGPDFAGPTIDMMRAAIAKAEGN
jgi:hypothetical protein